MGNFHGGFHFHRSPMGFLHLLTPYPMPYQAFALEQHNHIAQVRFARPEKANALNDQSWEEMPRLFAELDDDPEVRVVLLSGEGKHFCAGIDLQMLMSLNPTEVKDEGRKREALLRTIQRLQAATNAVAQCRKPVLAAIHGSCIGAGLDLVAACDLRYASEDARLMLKEVDMGFPADLGSLQRLPRLIPEGLVREMAYTAAPMDAATAQQVGLVNRVFADKAQLLEKTFEIAWQIAQKSPLAIRGTKAALDYARDHSVADGLAQVAAWNAATLLGHDVMKAMQAQMTQQVPDFED